MEARTHDSPRVATRSNLGWLAVALLLVCLMPTNQSLWIDEGFSLAYADEPTARAFGERLFSSPGGEPLMPLGMFSIWAGSKVFGRSELGLRASSVLWTAVAVIIMWRIGLLLGLPWLAAVFACHAFVWYYASEARPYAMTIALAAGVLSGMVMVLSKSHSNGRGIAALVVFGSLLCAAHSLATVPFGFVALVVGTVLAAQRWRPSSRILATAAVPTFVLLVLAAYYIPPYMNVRQNPWKQWASGLDSAFFATFEIFGFMGYAPGRTSLREAVIDGGLAAALEGLARPASIGILLLALTYLAIAQGFVMLRRVSDPVARRVVSSSAVVMLATIATATLASWVLGISFWGRHVAALMPFAVLAAVAACGRSGNRPPTLAIALASLLLASSLLIRFDPAHGRDDYRAASSYAVEASRLDRVVWWAANPGCAIYYGVRFCDEQANPKLHDCVVYVTNRDLATIPGDRVPEVVVVSKPDLHDASGSVRQHLANHDYRIAASYVAFTIYELPR